MYSTSPPFRQHFSRYTTRHLRNPPCSQTISTNLDLAFLPTTGCTMPRPSPSPPPTPDHPPKIPLILISPFTLSGNEMDVDSSISIISCNDLIGGRAGRICPICIDCRRRAMSSLFSSEREAKVNGRRWVAENAEGVGRIGSTCSANASDR